MQRPPDDANEPVCELTGELLPMGARGCSSDCACGSGVCYRVQDYDPLCFGSVCTAPCATDADCVDAYDAAGVPLTEGIWCTPAGECLPEQTEWPGLGITVCEL